MAYEVERRLGRGGMGVVDLAVDSHGRRVALKRLSLHGSAAEIAIARARIRREAEVLRGLDHPAIVRLLDVVDDGDDLVLVMPYLSGGSLHDRVVADGPLHPNEVMSLGDQLLDGLAAAHRQGIVHRDIKPANVLFDGDGRAHLVDFGVARTREHTPGLTAAEMVVGTPAFMAPEQAKGELATPAADVFSLGATLLYAATGSGPYGSSVADPRVLMHRAAAGKVERVQKSLPADLRARLSWMLARSPDRRPSAARARGGPAGTWPQSGLRPAIANHRLRTALLAAGLVVLALAGAVAVLADDGNSASSGVGRPVSTAPPPVTEPCRSLRYRACSGGVLAAAAPFTDGRGCVDGHADYDGESVNGCEAAPDAVSPGAVLDGSQQANLVPADDVDVWRVPVADRFQVLCDGAVHVSLTAPPGVSMQLEVLDGEGTLGRETSANGSTVSVDLGDPRCGSDDSTTLTARVSWVGSDRSADDYTLSVTGSF